MFLSTPSFSTSSQKQLPRDKIVASLRSTYSLIYGMMRYDNVSFCWCCRQPPGVRVRAAVVQGVATQPAGQRRRRDDAEENDDMHDARPAPGIQPPRHAHRADGLHWEEHGTDRNRTRRPTPLIRLPPTTPLRLPRLLRLLRLSYTSRLRCREQIGYLGSKPVIPIALPKNLAIILI